MFDIEDSDSLSVTCLDKERLNDLEINGRVDGECGMWVVFRNKNDYLLTIDTRNIHEIFEFKTVQEIINYLEN